MAAPMPPDAPVTRMWVTRGQTPVRYVCCGTLRRGASDAAARADTSPCAAAVAPPIDCEDGADHQHLALTPTAPQGSPPWAVGSAGAGPGGDDLLVGLELVREVRHCNAEGLRIVVRAVPGTLLRAEWARQVIVRVGDVGAMLRIESHLEEVRKTATVAARATRTAGPDRSRMHDVHARDVLRERRYRVVAIDALGHIDVPLRPAVGGPAGAGW